MQWSSVWKWWSRWCFLWIF